MIDLSLLHLTSEESLRDSEPPDISYWVPEHQGTGDFMRSQCMKLVLVSFKSTQLHVHYCHLTLMFVRATCAL